MTINQFYSDQQTNVGGVVKLYGRGTGAATSALTSVKGPWTITRSGVGTHSIVTSQKYAGLLNASFQVIDGGTIDDWEVVLSADLATGNTIGIQVFKGGVAADLPATAKLLIELTLANSAAKPAAF